MKLTTNQKYLLIAFGTIFLLGLSGYLIYDFLYAQFNKKFDKTITFVKK